MTSFDWIAVDRSGADWRTWAMAGDGAVLDQASGQTGPGGAEATLAGLLEPWLDTGPTLVLASGPLDDAALRDAVPVPCSPLDIAPRPVATQGARLALHALPGIRQTAPVDVLQGAAARIAGYLAQNPEFDGILCLPGPSTSWVHVSAREIVSFRGFLSSHLADLLIPQATPDRQGWDDTAFAAALDATLSRPETLAAQLHGLLAEILLHAPAPATSRARASGLLLGAELAATKAYWLGQPVVLIGAAETCAPYHSALGAQGIPPQTVDGDAMTLAGLGAARARLG